MGLNIERNFKGSNKNKGVRKYASPFIVGIWYAGRYRDRHKGILASRPAMSFPGSVCSWDLQVKMSRGRESAASSTSRGTNQQAE